MKPDQDVKVGQQVSQSRREAIVGETDAHWDTIKSRFVDDPQGAVDEADRMVNRALEDWVGRVRGECERLRQPMRSTGDEPSSKTDELRIRLQRYQAFFERYLGRGMH